MDLVAPWPRRLQRPSPLLSFLSSPPHVRFVLGPKEQYRCQGQPLYFTFISRLAPHCQKRWRKGLVRPGGRAGVAHCNLTSPSQWPQPKKLYHQKAWRSLASMTSPTQVLSSDRLFLLQARGVNKGPTKWSELQEQSARRTQTPKKNFTIRKLDEALHQWQAPPRCWVQTVFFSSKPEE